MDSLDDLFVDGLQKAYYTEKQLVDVLDELSSKSMTDEAADAFSEHKEETQEHVQRLEEVFESIDQSPETKEDKVTKALEEEHEEFESQDPSDEVRERFHIAAGQKTEHFEIAMYGNLIPIADDLGYDDVADTLEKTLREEEEALDKLSQVGEQFDNEQLKAE